MFYKELLEKTNSGKEYLLSAPIIESVMLGRFDLSTYIAFLNQAYHHVKHTVPLLMAAGSRLANDQRYLQPAILEYIDEEAGHELWILDDMEACGIDRGQAAGLPASHESEVMVSYLYDTVNRKKPLGIFGMVLVLDQRYLQPAILEYIDEEAGHELWILDDMEACGIDRGQAAGLPASHESEVMVSYLYDTVNRKKPLGIFGMVLVLEGTSAGLATEVAKIVRQQLALPAEAMSYLESHGRLDQQHLKGFEGLMDSIEDRDTQDAIIHTAEAVYRLYGDVYRAIPAQAEIWREVLSSSTNASSTIVSSTIVSSAGVA